MDKLKYRLVQVHKSLYQEIYPGRLSPWTLQFAKAKYGNEVTKHIENYIDFTYEPNNIKHKRIIDNKYNLYQKFNYKAKKGEWKTIEKFLKHVFDEENYRMALEYFWNLYLFPKQKLPFLGLVSEGKGTGKSTFLSFLAMIFKSNVTVVSGEDFKSRFNEHYANSLIITSDEHTEGKDRIKIAQKLKTLITEERIRVEAKFSNAYTSHCYFKIVFAGNNEEMLTIIESENTRYWIVKVSSLLETDIHILSKLKKEIPAFIYFLKNEFKARESRGRLYFAPEEFQTEASRLIQEHSKPDLQREIEEYIKHLFKTYDLNEIKYTPRTLAEDLDIGDLSSLKKVLKKNMKLKPCANSEYYHIGCRKLLTPKDQEEFKMFVNAKPPAATGRYYSFKKSDFI